MTEEDLPKYLIIEYDTYNDFEPLSYNLDKLDKYIVEKNVIF